jgi:tetratricopeptide (TPR) repeat protein
MKPSLALLIPAAVLLAACASPGRAAFDDGVRLYREGYYTSARDAFDTAVRQEPRNATAFNNRGVARVRLGDLNGAVLDYTRAMELAPADAEIVFNRGNAYAAAGNLPAAVNDFTAAVTLRPMYSQAYFNRGTVRAAAGDVTGAITDWQFAMDVERDPWTKAAMRRGSGLDYAYASPPAYPRAAAANPSAAVAVAPPAAPSPEALSPQALDVRALVARAMSREVEGDRAGAVADLRAAVVAEPDATRRARIDRLLRILEASR